MLPKSISFTRSVPPLHEIADINQLSRSDQTVKEAYRQFLQQFLEDIRGTNLTHGYKRVTKNSQDFDSAFYIHLLFTFLLSLKRCDIRIKMA